MVNGGETWWISKFVNKTKVIGLAFQLLISSRSDSSQVDTHFVMYAHRPSSYAIFANFMYNKCRVPKNGLKPIEAKNTRANLLRKMMNNEPTETKAKHQLPKNYHAAKLLIKKLGLNYTRIHACQAGYVLFRGQYEDATCCPKWETAVQRRGQKYISWKVLRHFPLIPGLKRMFRRPAISELLLWNAKSISRDGLLRHPCDSKAWGMYMKL